MRRGNRWEDLREFVREQITKAVGDTAHGKHQTLEAYRESVGFIRALDLVEEEMKVIAGQEHSDFMSR